MIWDVATGVVIGGLILHGILKGWLWTALGVVGVGVLVVSGATFVIGWHVERGGEWWEPLMWAFWALFALNIAWNLRNNNSGVPRPAEPTRWRCYKCNNDCQVAWIKCKYCSGEAPMPKVRHPDPNLEP